MNYRKSVFFGGGIVFVVLKSRVWRYITDIYAFEDPLQSKQTNKKKKKTYIHIQQKKKQKQTSFIIQKVN